MSFDRVAKRPLGSLCHGQRMIGFYSTYDSSLRKPNRSDPIQSDITFQLKSTPMRLCKNLSHHMESTSKQSPSHLLPLQSLHFFNISKFKKNQLIAVKQCMNNKRASTSILQKSSLHIHIHIHISFHIYLYFYSHFP